MRITTARIIAISLSLGIVAASLTGCGSSGGPDPKMETARLNKAQDMRSYFEKAHGNFDQLSSGDRVNFVQLCGGDEAKAKQTWEMMRGGPGGAPK